MHSSGECELMNELREEYCRSLQLSVISSHALVVEKDAVFGSLVEAQLWNQFPVILVTGSGMPDVATRAMLKSICTAGSECHPRAGLSQSLNWRHNSFESPQVQPFHCFGLVDWNPAGCDILLNYKYGNKKGCRESQACVFIPTSFDCWRLSKMAVYVTG